MKTELDFSSLYENLPLERQREALDFLKFLHQEEKKKKIKQSLEAFNEIEKIIGEDKGWESEEEMIKDLAEFRKKRMGLNE